MRRPPSPRSEGSVLLRVSLCGLDLQLPLLAGTGFGMMLFFSVSNTLIQTSVPDEMRGRVMGIWAPIFGGMIPLGSLEAGALAHIVDIPLTLATGAVLCAIAAAVALTVVVRSNACGRPNT